MAKVKGLDDFQRQIVAAKHAAHEMRQQLDKYQNWYASKSDWYKCSKQGQLWAKHLYEVLQMIEAIECIEFIGRKFDIRSGNVVLLNPGND